MNLLANLTPNEFVILNGALVILVVISFVFLRRGGPRPVRLRLMDKDTKVPQAAAKHVPPAQDRSSVKEKSLNVFFNYNGHTWDAYEVLGVPAGSSWQTVQDAFRKQSSTVQADSRAFIEAAYEAIQMQSKN